MKDKYPQFVLDITPSADLSAESFVVGKANAAAHKAVMDWPDWTAPALAIVGPEGAGKTHLGSIWVERAGARFMQLSTLAERHIKDGLKEPLCLDTGAEVELRHPEVLFHVLNLAKEEGLSVLILSRTPPARWPVSLPDLSSRLKAVPVVEIAAPDDKLLADVLAKDFRDAGITADEAVIHYLVPRMERSYDQAIRLARALAERTLAAKRRLTVPLAAEILEEWAGEE